MQAARSIRWLGSLGRGLLLVCVVVGVSGCWTAPNAITSAEYGAAQGAVIGGVFGCSFGYSFASRHHDETGFAIGCPVGIAVGALAGGLVGYAMYGPPPKPVDVSGEVRGVASGPNRTWRY